MKIGVFGGTFDPPHAAHLALAEAALEQLELDEVMFLPAFRNPLKLRGRPASAGHRLAMVKLLTEGQPKFSVSDIEIERRGKSYAYDTMSDLVEARPAEYWFLMGGDALRTFQEWKRPDKLVRLCRLGVALRPPYHKEDLLIRLSPDIAARVDFVEMPPSDISSTDIRDRLAMRRSLVGMIPDSVLSYIQSHGLYQAE